MKKLFLSIFAVAALFSCSKSDVIYDTPSEIGLYPVAQKATRAAVNGTEYPSALNMYVFANAGTATAINDSFEDEVYFANALFVNKGGVFGGSPTPYYWPNVKKLIFSGVSASGNVNKAIGEYTSVPSYSYKRIADDESTTIDESTNSEWQITLENYTPGYGSSANGDNDLLWFPTVGPYAKDHVMGSGNDGDVDVEMKHACAWITINIKGDGVTGAANTSWTIDKLELDNLSTQGTATLGAAANWDNLADAGEVTLQELNPGVKLTSSNDANYKDLDYTDGTADNGEKFYGLVVIPQPTCNLNITYSYNSQGDIRISETKPVSLALSSNSPWAAGVHYTYNITIGTTEILVEPVIVNWTPSSETTDTTL